MHKLTTIVLLFSLIFLNLAFSQDEKIKPLLQIRFPADGDTVSYSKIRIAGCTSPHTIVLINGVNTHVYPSGAFVDRVELKPLDNEIFISAKDSVSEIDTVLHIYRQPPIPVSPDRPTEIDTRIIWPVENITMISGDIIEVRFKGSPGGKAKFRIDDLCKNIPMTELNPRDAQGMRGIYSGIVRLHSKKLRRAQPVKFELRGVDGKKRKAKSRGLIVVQPDHIPLIGETRNQTYLKTSPYGWGIMTILQEGVRLHITGQRGFHYKVRLTENSYAYVATRDVNLLPAGTPIPKTSISLPSISVN